MDRRARNHTLNRGRDSEPIGEPGREPGFEPTRDPDRVPGRTSRQSGGAILVRVYWMLLGYIPIVACVAALVEPRSAAPWADLAFWTSVVLILLARLVDVLMLGGRTAEGDPANLAHWTRHAAVLMGIALIAWFCLRRI